MAPSFKTKVLPLRNELSEGAFPDQT